MITETIELGANTRLLLTDDHMIMLEGGARHSGTSRVVVRDVTSLRRELFNLDLIRHENVAREDRQALASEPIDRPTRKALFAALRERYGELSDDDRLAKVSAFAGRQIWSMSQRGNMTMSDASRVFDVLNAL